ncbi:hypothetical protein EON68_02975, partial [archaeon]
MQCAATFVKATGYAPGMLQLTHSGQLVWTPRAEGYVPDPDDANAHSPDPDAVAPPRRPRRLLATQITAVFLRCFRLQDCAVEIFFSPYGGTRKRRYFFAFEGGASARNAMLEKLRDAMSASQPDSNVLQYMNKGAGALFDTAVNAGNGYAPSIYGSMAGNGVAAAYVQIPRTPASGSGASTGYVYNYEHNFRVASAHLTAAWMSRRLSNFDYLMALNTLAGRGYNDLTQYPVFPWVLSDYTSPALDITDPASYRDLTRPMGALAIERLKEFRARFSTLDEEVMPRFLYGSHYSTAVGTIVHYLIRLHPFTRIHVAYQDGHFDVTDRLFSSVEYTWSMNTQNMSEVKELTPEWYSQPHFLVNHARYNFGELQDGTRVVDEEVGLRVPL